MNEDVLKSDLSSAINSSSVATASASIKANTDNANTLLENIDANTQGSAAAVGAAGTGISQPTGGSGFLGWLSGIYQNIVSVATNTGNTSTNTSNINTAVSKIVRVNTTLNPSGGLYTTGVTKSFATAQREVCVNNDDGSNNLYFYVFSAVKADTVASSSPSGGAVLHVTDGSKHSIGDIVLVDPYTNNEESLTVQSINGNDVTMTGNLTKTHASNAAVETILHKRLIKSSEEYYRTFDNFTRVGISSGSVTAINTRLETNYGV